MAKKWRWSVYGQAMKFEVVKETAKLISFREKTWPSRKEIVNRETKESKHHQWFDTWEEMQVWRIERAKRAVDDAEHGLALALDFLDKIQAWQKPEDA